MNIFKKIWTNIYTKASDWKFMRKIKKNADIKAIEKEGKSHSQDWVSARMLMYNPRFTRVNPKTGTVFKIRYNFEDLVKPIFVQPEPPKSYPLSPNVRVMYDIDDYSMEDTVVVSESAAKRILEKEGGTFTIGEKVTGKYGNKGVIGDIR